MRITTGQWRGHKLFTPDTVDTRPTMDKTRQAVFNILRSAPWALRADGTPLLQGARVLDVFAGSGALGFEALSQGAAFCTFFENAPLALQAIAQNAKKLQAAAQMRVVTGDVLRAPVSGEKAADMVFFDPPYQQGLLAAALPVLHERGWFGAATLLVMELRKGEELGVAGLGVFDTRAYGMAKIVFGRLAS